MFIKYPLVTYSSPFVTYNVDLCFSLLEDMHKLCKEREGGPVLYELIEVCLMHDKLLLNI